MKPYAPPPGYSVCLDEEAKEYIRRSIFLSRPSRKLPENLEWSKVAVVGDYVSRWVWSLGFKPKIVIVDCVSKREPIPCPEPPSGYHIIEVYNPRGCVSWCSWFAVSLAWSKPGLFYIRVYGEEDLVAVAALIEAPQDAVVIYGLPWGGFCLVESSWGSTLASHISRVARKNECMCLLCKNAVALFDKTECL